MDYRRYAAGHYARAAWIRCTECGTADRPFYVWQGSDRETNFSLQIGAVMEHENTAHPVNPRYVKR